MKQEGRLGGVCVLAFAVAYLAVALSIPTAAMGDPLGPTAFPVVLGGFMALLGITLAARPDRAREGGDEAPGRWGIVAALAGLLGLYGYSLPVVGYPLGTFLFLGITARLLGERSWSLTVGLSASVSLGVYVLFTRALDVPLPLGIIEGITG
ncbi:MAG: integral rane protein [candidate division NC10 bacterium]|nr:integral rane protein [candidate division NC10 bacterium]